MLCSLDSKDWKHLERDRRIHGTTILRHCLDKCWHGRNRAKGIQDPTRAAEALACLHRTQLEDQMHAILFCPHHKLVELRTTAHLQLAQPADALI